MKTYFKIICLIFLFSLLIPLLTKAITFESPFKAKSFEELIDAIINFIFWVAIAIVPIMIVVAAFYFLTSGGDPEKVRTAKRIILFTFIGLLVIFLARGITSLIEQILTGSPLPPPPACTPDGPNGSCPAHCSVDQDPDCGCKNGDGWCGIGCSYAGDNDCLPPWFTAELLSKLGDIDKDCEVDEFDVFKLFKAFGSKPGDPNWDPDADLNDDMIVDSCDQSILTIVLGLQCAP